MVNNFDVLTPEGVFYVNVNLGDIMNHAIHFYVVLTIVVLVGKPEGKRPLERPRRSWMDNIRMDLQEVGCVYMDWIGLAQDRDRWRTLVSVVMNLRVP